MLNDFYRDNEEFLVNEFRVKSMSFEIIDPEKKLGLKKIFFKFFQN
jgi:hypothetical protein